MAYRKARQGNNLRLAVLAPVILFASFAGADIKAPPYVEYYRGGFDDVLASAFDTFELAKYCKINFPEECGELDLNDELIRKLAGNLSLFRHVFDRVEVKKKQLKFSSLMDFRSVTTASRNEFLDKLLGFELDFSARYIAVLESCGKPATLTWFNSVVNYDLGEFWRVDTAQKEEQMNIIARKKINYASQLNENSEADLCIKAQALGLGLAGAIYAQERSVVAEENRNIDSDRLLLQEGFMYVYKIAFLLNDEAHHGTAVSRLVKKEK